jgi:ABC-2 type transport system ATP-binding protein
MDSFQLLIQIYDLEPLSARRRIQELAEILDCTHVLKTQLRRLSLGERMKMEIIGSLLHEPEILFLDEPTIGLDIVAQTSIRKFLDHYVKTKGPTVILTSHYMDDIAMLADQLLLISKGTIVYDGSVNDFIKKADLKQKLTFTTSEKLESDFLVEPGMKLLQGEQNFSLQVHSKDLARVLTKITTQKIQDLKIEEADFEEIIRSFMEKESRVF